MDAKDLRLGNFVLVENDYEEVVGINKYEITCRLDETSHGVNQSINDIKPITLTEEWLKKFGFNDGMAHYYINASSNEVRPLKLMISISESGLYISLWDESEEVVIFEGDKYYVHQLQNLYFSLSDKELVLK